MAVLKAEGKISDLKEILAGMDSVLVAFSGGVDSTFLLKACHDVLHDHVLAVTASSPTYPRAEIDNALEMAQSLGVRHLLLETKELDNREFVANSPQRCYHCKRELFSDLQRIAGEHGLGNVVDGANADDVADYRPGMRAAQELGVRHPLQEAGLTKEEIRALSKEQGLPTWDKPSLACLASRLPYGMPIEERSLAMIEAGEAFIRGLGVAQVRLRHHGDTARIEVEPKDMSLLLEEGNRTSVVAHLRELGYLYVALDLAGYRTGSMNEGLEL